MAELKPVALSDRGWMREILTAENSRSGDFCFTNIFLWSAFFHPLVVRCADRILIKLNTPHGQIYSFPVGTGNLVPAIEALTADSKSTGCPLRIRGITRENVELLQSAYPGRFDYELDRDACDYVYLAEGLATLSGKKLHAKRNFVNRFTEDGDWDFEALTPEKIPECAEMLTKWVELNSENSEQSLSYELSALENAFRYFSELGLEGGLLRKYGRVIAFTMGEKLNSDTFIVHYEKAFADVPGAYAMVNREFVRRILENHPEIVYINREDDMGSENLRKAKESYRPEFLVEKFTAIER